MNQVSSNVLTSIRSKTEEHMHNITSVRSDVRHVDVTEALNDEDLLAQIGYKQELNRSYNTLQVFGIAFSIMGLLPSIVSTLATGLEAGPGGLVWGWFISGIFILSIGVSMSVLSSSIPTSGGLFYWTNYFCPDKYRVPLSFIIGCSNSLALCSGFCSVNYGFSFEVLAAVYINMDGDFNITSGKEYGVFAAAIVTQIVLCCLTTSHTAKLQAISIVINCFLILLFLIAVPVGAAKNGFNDAAFIFGNFDNVRTWSPGWSFMLSWMPAIWTIGAFDSCLHMSEEAKNATKSIPIGINGAITVCWLVGWFICIVFAACIKDGDVIAVLETSTGSSGAQIIYDALGKKWAVAFMSLIAFAQYLMASSLLVAASRQIWAFARDDGLPVVYKLVKKVDPRIKVPVNATIFAGCLSLIIGLLILVNATAANALFSLGVVGNYLSWGMPVFLVLLPYGAARFVPGKFYFGKTITNGIHCTTVAFITYAMIMAMFPDSKEVDKDTMNYTCAINGGVWILALVYFYTWGYKYYTGPKSNLDSSSESDADVHIDEVMEMKE